MHIYYKGYLFKSLTGYDPTNPTMTGYEQKVQDSRTCPFHMPGCLSRSWVDSGIPKK